MKRVKYIILSYLSILFLLSCDKGFEEMNATNPNVLGNIDPGYLFSNAQRQTYGGSWESEATVAQQFVNAYNLGNTAGLQFNANVDQYNRGRWNDTYTGPLKYWIHLDSMIKNDPARTNMYNQARIWKAYNFMTLVDAYGDVPYSEAGLAYYQATFYPKYDDDEQIYASLYNEIKTATAALDPAKDYNRFDIFFPTATAATQTAQWKKVGYSLLLRLGMRYSKKDPNKARDIVREAFSGGVMQTNADNVVVKYMTATGAVINGYNNPLNAGPRNTNPFFYYLTEPLINQLKSTGDPRLKYISAMYPNKNSAPSNNNPDTATANQFGFPIGYSDATIQNAPGYRAPAGGGQNYSQPNYRVFFNQTAPLLFLTNAQTKLLLAEAAFRGWLSGLPGAKTAQEYYEEGVRASMDNFTLYPNTTPISAANQTGYLSQPAVAYNNTDALRLINTQYWIASFGDGLESWANFRRSGYPPLTPNPFAGGLPGGGFIRRLAYPTAETSVNSANYNAAVGKIGADDLTTRVFWDTP